MISSLTPSVSSKLKQRAYLCVSITMSAINASLLTLVRSKNSVALLSTTRMQSKPTDRIILSVNLCHIYWKSLVTNWLFSINSHRYHPKISFPLYTDSIADHYVGLGLSWGLSNHWRAYDRPWSGSSASVNVYEKKHCSIVITSCVVEHVSIICRSSGIPP